MTAYVLADGWAEGLVRDIASAIIHRNAELGGLVGVRRVSAVIHPARVDKNRDGTPRLVPAKAEILVGGRRHAGDTPGAQAALHLLGALAKACGIAEVPPPLGAGPGEPLEVLWRRPQTPHEGATMQAVAAMREDRETAMLGDFINKWVKAA